MTSDKRQPNLIDGINQLIHEPSRYNIMALLYVLESADFVFVQKQTGLSPGNLSAHIRRLSAAGYLKIDKRFAGNFPRTNLTLTGQGRRDFEKYREKMLGALGSVPKKR